MKPDLLDHYLPVAKKLALEAGHLVLSYLDPKIKKEKKPDQSVVTKADLEADKLITSNLHKAFPDHGILSEEGGFIGNKNSKWIWVIDPLDGTRAFAEAKPGFCVMIGLLHDKKPTLGVVYDPLEKRLYFATKGHGAFLNHSPSSLSLPLEEGRPVLSMSKGTQGEGEPSHKLTVSSRSNLSIMPLVISTGFPTDDLQKIQKNLTGPILKPINSVGIKVGFLVRKEADIYVNHHEVQYWDTVAPQIILEEAGGKFTKLDGSELNYDLKNKSFSHESKTLATNGRKHDEIVNFVI